MNHPNKKRLANVSAAVLNVHQRALSASRLGILYRSYLVGGHSNCLHFSQQGYRARPLLTLAASRDGRAEASDGWRYPLGSHLVEKRQRHVPLTLLGTGVYRSSKAHLVAPNAKRSHLRHNMQPSQERREGRSCRSQLHSFDVVSTKDGNSLSITITVGPADSMPNDNVRRTPFTAKVHVEDDAHPRNWSSINRNHKVAASKRGYSVKQ